MHIEIKRRNGESFQVFFDAEDKTIVEKHSWRISSGLHYAITNVKGKTILMHRMLLNYPNLDIDHINRNGLDNRRKNLRVVSHAVNLHNGKSRAKRQAIYSKHKGVCWRAHKRHWRAYVYINGKCKEVGSYKDEAMAIQRQEEVELALFGPINSITTGRLSSGEGEED